MGLNEIIKYWFESANEALETVETLLNNILIRQRSYLNGSNSK